MRDLAAAALRDIEQAYLVRCRAEKRLDGKTVKAYRRDSTAAVRSRAERCKGPLPWLQKAGSGYRLEFQLPKLGFVERR